MPVHPVQNIAGQVIDGEHQLLVRVYYEDTDFTGIVYHANYLKFFERGRSDYLRLWGVHHHELIQLDDPLAFAVAHLAIAYKSPARIDDVICVKTRFAGAKGAQMFLDQKIFRDDKLLCEAELRIVCIDGRGRPKRLPRILADLAGTSKAES